MSKKYIIWLVILVLSISCGCSNTDDGIIIPEGNDNLIKNGSFESNNSPTLDGWTVRENDTSYVTLSTDTPINGGKFSVRLRNIWTVPGEIHYKINPPDGTH